MKTDKVLHIAGSAVLTLTIGAKAAFAAGALIEVNDHQEFKCPVKHCIEDVAANCVGIAIGLLIKKLL